LTHLLLRGGTVFTGTAVIPHGFVEIDGARIGRVGAVAELTSDFGARAIDTAGMTVLPGVIDTHVHVMTQPHDLRLPDAAASIWAVRYLETALRAGVTTVRDMGAGTPAIFGLREALDAGYVTGPRLLAAGPAIAMTGGHGWHELSLEADGIDGVRRAARDLLKRGADLIKLMATGGAGTPGSPGAVQLSTEEMAAGVIEAHNAGKPAAAHALGTQGILNAVAAGVDTIEHGVFLDERAIEAMLKHGTTLCPTLSVYHRIVDRAGAAGALASMIEKARAIVGPHAESFRMALAAGVPVVFGTDAGALWHPIGDVGDELRLMVENGMTAVEALRSATAIAADVCHISDRTGSLRQGLEADVLVVEGDATADVAALGRVSRVYRAGALVFSGRDETQTPL
jgi:imidazolonepropionase-like amidohydrolase